ncbi:hypothetical protein CMV_014502 [Castanea mollissima]|uniref:Uncharacterized protein n=1 Tax=Castanea mollissima TaxID=60419 RepID=A0A8J4QY15_9ROSI|nr:hypothetical protein CMV_014502 [Castanea mollissima]
MRLALISCFMFLSSLFHPAYSSSSIRPLCRIDESSALLQFKESFIVNSSTCLIRSAYPKVASWMLEGENNSCCLWDGVDCDDDTVPNQLANISSLTALALHNCRLVGQFPIRILQLPNLQFLELWNNFDLKGYLPHLHLSSRLKYLSAGNTGFSGEIPASIGNLDSLERLDLRDCKFSGLIPPSLVEDRSVIAGSSHQGHRLLPFCLQARPLQFRFPCQLVMEPSSDAPPSQITPTAQAELTVQDELVATPTNAKALPPEPNDKTKDLVPEDAYLIHFELKDEMEALEDEFHELVLNQATTVASSRIPSTPATPDYNGSTPVITKDVTLNPNHNTWVRIFLPRQALDNTSTNNSVGNTKLPLIVYYHGGGFILLNADSTSNHDFCFNMALQLSAVVVSVEYRLTPEHRLPAAYDDSMEALHWIKCTHEKLLRDFADYSKCFLMGTSAGGNIAYHVGLRASTAVGDFEPLKIKGLILHHLFFGGSKRTESELRLFNNPVLPLCSTDLIWKLALPIGVDRDHEYCNPTVGGGFDHFDQIRELGWWVVVTGCDGEPLIDRQMELVEMLKKKGVKVEAQFNAARMVSRFCDPYWNLLGVDRDHEYCNPTVGGGSQRLEKNRLLGWRVLVIDCKGDPLIGHQIELVKMMEEKGLVVASLFDEGGHHGVDL